MRRSLLAWVLAALFLPAVASASWVDLVPGATGQPAGVFVVDQGDSYVVFDVLAPRVLIEPVKDQHGRFVKVSLPGAGVFGAIGDPMLPAYQPLVMLPAKGNVGVRVLDRKTVTICLPDRGFEDDLLPVQAPVPKILGALENAPFAFNQTTYSANAFLGLAAPKATAQKATHLLTGNDRWMGF